MPPVRIAVLYEYSSSYLVVLGIGEKEGEKENSITLLYSTRTST